MINKLTRLWDKFLTWLWWPAVKEAIEDKKNKKRGGIMEEQTSNQDEKTTSVIRIEEPSLEQTQLAEQLYNSAGLDLVVDAGLKDYDKRLQQENKLISKVLGPRGSDIRGYGEAVARRVAFAVYALLNKQYGGRVGDLRSYIMTLQEERDRANTKYDELLGRVVGILGDEYKELRTDSKQFMEKLTTTLGEDLKGSKIDHKALAERLADIDDLRSQIKTLKKEKAQLKERHDSQITALTNQHSKETEKLRSQIAERDSKIAALDSQLTDLGEEKERLTQGYESQIAERDSKIGALDSEKAAISRELKGLKTNYERLRRAVKTLPSVVPYEEIRKKLAEELYAFVLKDSKVPDMVIDGVGKFLDFKKYLGIAVETGAKEGCKRAKEILGRQLDKP